MMDWTWATMKTRMHMRQMQSSSKRAQTMGGGRSERVGRHPTWRKDHGKGKMFKLAIKGWCIRFYQMDPEELEKVF